MEIFRLWLYGRDGALCGHREVACEREELWGHAKAFAYGGQPGDRLHIRDGEGETLAIMGAKSARALADLATPDAPIAFRWASGAEVEIAEL